MAKKKNNDNDGGLTDMIYDMTGIEPQFMLIGMGVLIIIIIIACLFYFNMIPDFDSIIKSITPSVAAPSAATTPSAAAHSAATTPAATTPAATPTAPTAPAKFFNNTNNPPSVGSFTMPQQQNVSDTSFMNSNQLTPPPSLKGGLRNSRMR